MRPTRALVDTLGTLCVGELQKRERPDDVTELNVAVIVWNERRTELFVRDGTAGLERAIRNAVAKEGR